MSQIIQSTKLINGVDLKTPPLVDPPLYAEIVEAPKKLIVACVWWGTKYGRDYVEKLRNSVKRHLTIPYPEEIRKIQAPKNSEGWWQKVNLFKEDIFPKDSRVLYLDLDIVITNSLDDIVKSKGEIVMIENFGPNKKHAAYNSSCMVWTPNDNTQRIHNAFSKEITKELHGDQCWIWRVMTDEKIRAFRKDLAESYKYNTRTRQWKRSSKNTAVWVFHGKPDPHEVKDRFIVDNWR
jgi:hypothetical protein